MLRQADDSDTEEKKKAIDYLDQTIRIRDEYVHKTMSVFNERVKREELMTAIRDVWFKGYTLRLKISGKQVVQVKENVPAQMNDSNQH